MATTISKDVLLQVRLSRRERTRWHAAAQMLDMSLSELIRETVRARVATLVLIAPVEEPPDSHAGVSTRS